MNKAPASEILLQKFEKADNLDSSKMTFPEHTKQNLVKNTTQDYAKTKVGNMRSGPTKEILVS